MLLDTDVMVDVLRGYQPALEWLAVLGDEPIGLPGFVAMELIQGCRNQVEQRSAESLLRRFILFWPTDDDCSRALADFTAYHLSHALGLLDSMIAEIAIGAGQELITFNAKHYSVIPSLQLRSPYQRS